MVETYWPDGTAPYTPQQFGAVGDGSSHPLTEQFSDYKKAQAYYSSHFGLSDVSFISSSSQELDQVGIQAAIEAGGAGAIVFIPPGTYLIDKALAANKASMTFDLAPGAILKVKDSSDVSMFSVTAADVTIRGGELDGNRANQSTGSTLVSSSAARTTVRECYLHDAYSYGVRSTNSDGGRVLNCRIADTRLDSIFFEALAADVADVLIQGNIVDKTGFSAATVTSVGINLKGNSPFIVKRARVIGNTVIFPTNPTSGGAICIQAFGGVPRASITANTTAGGYTGISCDTTSKGTITGNTVNDAKAQGIELAASTYCTVTGNVVDGNALTPVGVSVSSSSTNCTIQGNSLLNLVNGASARGVKVNTGSYFTITGNVIDVVNGHGIECISVTRLTISANQIYGNGTALKAVNLDTCTSGTAISGNQMFNFSQHGIQVYAASAVTIQDLTISGNAFDTTTVAYGTSLSGGAVLGSRCLVVGNTGANNHEQILDWKNNVKVLVVSGTPESAQTAGVGSIAGRSDGGASTTLYVKESGTGNTGWVAK